MRYFAICTVIVALLLPSMVRADDSNAKPALESEQSAEQLDMEGVADAEDDWSAQQQVAHNAVFAELAGPGILYSINYERRFNVPVVLRAGMSLFSVGESGTDNTMTWFTMPVTASYLLGWGSHHLEMGGGITWGYAWSDLNQRPGATDEYWLLAGLIQLGYRFQPPEGGFLLRVMFTPMYGGQRFALITPNIQWWGGLSAGWAF